MALSNAVHVTEVIPSINQDPEAGEQDEFLIPELSEDVNANVCVTLALLLLLGAVTMFAGQVTFGAAVSVTDSVNEQLLCLLTLSRTVHVTW